MRVYNGLESMDAGLQRCVLTVGNFDGVHRAHQQLLAQAGMFAAHTGGPVTVLSFEPHPLTVVTPAKAPPRLTTPDQKIELLGRYGAQAVVVARSEPALLGLEAEDFVETVIVRRFRPTHVVEGASFGFGRGRKGTPALLEALGPRFGYQTHVVGPVTLEIAPGETVMVSSSLVRRFLLEGQVRRAALCLGRPYVVAGTVEPGLHRGRALGFPTANLAPADQLLPADGVYAGLATIRTVPAAGVGRVGETDVAGQAAGKAWPAAISIGAAPTFADAPRRLEVHLLNYEGDLYGCGLDVAFNDWLRPQRKFDSVEQLRTQLLEDVRCVRERSAEC